MRKIVYMLGALAITGSSLSTTLPKDQNVVESESEKESIISNYNEVLVKTFDNQINNENEFKIKNNIENLIYKESDVIKFDYKNITNINNEKIEEVLNNFKFEIILNNLYKSDKLIISENKAEFKQNQVIQRSTRG